MRISILGFETIFRARLVHASECNILRNVASLSKSCHRVLIVGRLVGFHANLYFAAPPPPAASVSLTSRLRSRVYIFHCTYLPVPRNKCYSSYLTESSQRLLHALPFYFHVVTSNQGYIYIKLQHQGIQLHCDCPFIRFCTILTGLHFFFMFLGEQDFTNFFCLHFRTVIKHADHLTDLTVVYRSLNILLFNTTEVHQCSKKYMS